MSAAEGKRFVSSLLVMLIEEVRGLHAEIVALRRDVNEAAKVAIHSTPATPASDKPKPK